MRRSASRHHVHRALRSLLIATAVVVAGTVAPSNAHPASAACGSFQSMVNAASAGSTITIPSGCVYHETVTIGKRLTVNASGVTIDGDNVRSGGLRVTSSDVTVNGLTVTRVRASDPYYGAVWTTGVSRFTFRGGYHFRDDVGTRN